MRMVLTGDFYVNRMNLSWYELSIDYKSIWVQTPRYEPERVNLFLVRGRATYARALLYKLPIKTE